MPEPNQNAESPAEPEASPAKSAVPIPQEAVDFSSQGVRPTAMHPIPTVIRAEQQRIHSGPIPSPDVLRGYNDIVPNAAERIIQMAEQQQAHRHAMETNVLVAQIEEDKRRHTEVKIGQKNGLIATVMAFSVAGLALILGYQAAAIAIGGTTLASLVAVFITGKVTAAPPATDTPEAPEASNTPENSGE